jgi:hypothetical protein
MLVVLKKLVVVLVMKLKEREKKYIKKGWKLNPNIEKLTKLL